MDYEGIDPYGEIYRSWKRARIAETGNGDFFPDDLKVEKNCFYYQLRVWLGCDVNVDVEVDCV